MSKHPEIVCGAFIKNDKGEIALFKSSKWKTIMVPPGGHIEFGETLEDSVKREVKEEVGVAVSDVRYIRFGELVEEPFFYRKAHLIFFHFLCSVDTKNLMVDNDEIIGYEWHDLDFWLLSGRINKTTRDTLVEIKKLGLL